MAQTIQTGLHIKGLTADTETLLVSGSSLGDVFVVKDDGKVGIGTMSPSEKLEVSGKTKTQNLQINSGDTNIGYVLTATDSFGNNEWRFYSGITSVIGISPISATTGLNPIISISNSKADDTTKGAATFSSSDFNDDNNGLISIDYNNGQSASSITKGFLTSSDWNLFNNKEDIITLTTTGTTGPSTFNTTTNVLNIPQYGGSGGSSLGHSLSFGFGGASGQIIDSNSTYTFGANYISAAIKISGTSATTDRVSRSLLVNKTSTITKASVIFIFASSSVYPQPTGTTLQIVVHNITSGTSSVIDSSFPIGGGANPSANGWFSSVSPAINPNRNTLYTLSSPFSVTQGDRIQIRLITPAWNASPTPSRFSVFVTLFLE